MGVKWRDPEEPKSRVQAVQELRRSGAAGKHRDKRSRRARARDAARRRAIDESS